MADTDSDAPPAQGRKPFRLNKTTVIAGSAALLAGLAWFIYKRRKTATTATATASTSTASGQDYAGDLSAMQTELESLLGAESAESGGSSPAGGGTKTTATTGTTTKTTSSTGTTTKTVPSTPAAHATGSTATSVTLAWAAVTGATSYRTRVTYQNKLVRQQVTTGTKVTVSGLTPDHTYGFHVAATGPGGTSAEGDVSVKTPR